MQVKHGFKTELDLNNEQITLCKQHAGVARFAYNWGLEQSIEARKRGEKRPTAIDLHKKLNELKATEFPWMYESSKSAPQEALRNLNVAYENFFLRVKKAKEAKKKGKKGKTKLGFPKFKTKKHGLGSFSLTGTIKVMENSKVARCGAIQLPVLGELRLKEGGYLPVGAKISQATVSEKNDRWYPPAAGGPSRC